MGLAPFSFRKDFTECASGFLVRASGGCQSAYPARCPQAWKRFGVDTFPGDDGRVTLRVRHPDDNAPVLLKTNELVHEKR